MFQKNSGNFPIKFVPFDTLYHYYTTDMILQKISGNFPIIFVPFDTLYHYYTTDMILQKISGNFPIKFVPFYISQYTTYLHCKRFQATSLSNLSHFKYYNILHTYIAKDFRHLPLSNLSHNYTWDVAKKLRQLPIKIVPFDFSLYTRLNIAKDLRQFPIKFVSNYTCDTAKKLHQQDFRQLPYQICPI